MTIAELIEILNTMPEDALVDIDYTGYYEADITISPFIRGDIVYLGLVDANP